VAHGTSGEVGSSDGRMGTRWLGCPGSWMPGLPSGTIPNLHGRCESGPDADDFQTRVIHGDDEHKPDAKR